MSELQTTTEQRRTLEVALDNMSPALKSLLHDPAIVERFKQVSIQAYKHSEGLKKCSPDSVLASIYEAAAQGLELDPKVGHAYLVPRWNGRNKRMECQLQRGYRGVIYLALQDPKWDRIEAHLVYDGDHFQCQLGTDPRIDHRPYAEPDPEKWTHAYAVAFGQKGYQFAVMTRAQVLRIRDNHGPRNKAGAVVGPWKDHEEEMAKKTVLHRLGKMIDLKPATLSRLIADELRHMGVDDEGDRLPENVRKMIDVQGTTKPVREPVELAAAIAVPGQKSSEPEAEPDDYDPGPPPQWDEEVQP